MEHLKPSTRGLALAALAFSIAAFVVAALGVATAKPTRVIVRKGDIAPGAVTAKALAKGAVHPKAIAKKAIHGGAIAPGAIHEWHLAPESVSGGDLVKGAVGTAALANNAVTAAQLAPGSVYGGALAPETVVTKPIADLDVGAHNIEWTASNIEAALCGPGEALLGSGFAFTNPGNNEASWLQALPIMSGPNRGVLGRISSDSGGTAAGEIAAICLGKG